MTKRASGEKLPTVNNIHKLRVRLTTLEDGDEAGLTSDDIGDGLVLKDNKIEVFRHDSLKIYASTGQMYVDVVLQCLAYTRSPLVIYIGAYFVSSHLICRS